MALRLVTAPTSEPLTLLEGKEHLRIDHTAEDALVADYIAAARVRCEAIQRRAYLTQTWELTLDAFPCDGIVLPRPPLQSVTSITYTDSDGVVQTLDEALYQVDTDSEPGRVYPAYDTYWPSTRSVPNAVRIRYVAGVTDSANVPESVKMAMRFWLGHYYLNRESVIAGTIATVMPEAAKALLLPDAVPAVLG